MVQRRVLTVFLTAQARERGPPWFPWLGYPGLPSLPLQAPQTQDAERNYPETKTGKAKCAKAKCAIAEFAED